MDIQKSQNSKIQKVSIFASWFGGLILLLCALSISIDVVTRNVFNATYLQSFELSQYGFAIAVAFGLSAGVVGRDHIRIDVLANVLPKKIQRFLHLVSIVSIVMISLLLLYFSVELSVSSFDRGMRSSTSLRIYTWIPQLIWVLGLFVFFLTSTWTLVKSIKCLLIKDYESYDSLIGFQGKID